MNTQAPLILASNSPRRKELLASFDEAKFVILVAKLDLDDPEPFTLTLRNVLTHEKTDEIAGFNDHSRQMTSDQFQDLIVPKVEFEVQPARVKHAQPPKDFEELLGGLEK